MRFTSYFSVPRPQCPVRLAVCTLVLVMGLANIHAEDKPAPKYLLPKLPDKPVPKRRPIGSYPWFYLRKDRMI